MKGEKITNHNHVARYCKTTQVSDEQIQATAFMLRQGEESLSVNWLECLKCSSRENELIELRKVYNAKLTVGARAKIAVLNVGEVRQKVLMGSPDNRELEFLHDPEDNDLSHSGIYKLKYEDELIAELICETVQEIHPARK